MTGTERLRAIAGAWDEWGLGGSLTEIADQIEREFARHDEPDSTDKDARLPYVTDEDREVLEWVRKYGGIGCVQTMAAKLGDTLNWIRERAGLSKYEAVDYNELLDALDRRLVPDGVEWPRYEDGEPVRFGDELPEFSETTYKTVKTISIQSNGYVTIDNAGGSANRTVIVRPGERVKRPAVLADVSERHVGGYFQKSRKVANSLTSHSDASDVSMSAYDLLPQEERDAIAWVRKHGGIDHVRAEWISRVPHDLYERRRQRLLDHIAECETALGRRREIISKLGHRVSDLTRENSELRKRAMPEGCEWPRYESGYLVMFGDCVENSNGTCTVNSVRFYSGGGVTVYGEGRGAQFVVVTEPVMHDPIRKANPKVIAADGEPLEVGQTVWWLNNPSCNLTVDRVDSPECVSVTDHFGDETQGLSGIPARELTHQRPVLGADGVPIELGDDLYSVEGSLKLHVSNIDRVNCRIATSAMFALDKWADPSMFTHTKPEIDSWERIEEDATLGVNSYRERYGVKKHDGMTWPQLVREDLVRRCRALAERERGE